MFSPIIYCDVTQKIDYLKGSWWEEHKVAEHEIPQSWKRQEVDNMGPGSLWWKGQQGGSEY